MKDIFTLIEENIEYLNKVDIEDSELESEESEKLKELKSSSYSEKYKEGEAYIPEL